jgi:hypothetical protein
MAQISKETITVGGNRIVGQASVDGGALRGDGGPAKPQLIVPLTIEMYNSPSGAMLALCWLRASLAPDQHASPPLAVAKPVTELLLDNLPARSLPTGSSEHTVPLRFHLTPMEIAELERKRHQTPGDVFTLYLGLDAVVAGVKTYNQVGPQANTEDMPWDLQYGMFSEFLPFWRTDIRPVLISIEQSSWVRDVLPGIGYDRARLIEMKFPPPLPDHPSAASEWDKARRAFNERRYSDCVAECRDILAMWQQQLGATKESPVAKVISARRAWHQHDNRLAFLDGLWKAAIDIVNTPHHPEGQQVEQHFDSADAHLMLTLTAALSEHVCDESV